MLFTGKKVGVGVSIEDERGVKKLPIQYWFPWTDNTFFERARLENLGGAFDTLVDSFCSEVTKKWAEGTLGGQVYPNGIGFFLKALLGSVQSNGENGIYEHRFTLLESNTHPSLTIGTVNPLGSEVYALAMIESLDLNAEVGGKFMVSINVKSRRGEVSEHRIEYLDEKGFVSNMLQVFLADSVGEFDSADNICVQSVTISLKKEIKDIECLSHLDPIDYINTSFSIEGSMELLFENNSYKDWFLDGTSKALRLLAVDKKHPYGDTDYPTFMLDLSMVTISDWTPAFTLDDITKQSISFKGHYDLKSKKAIEIYLKNTQESY